MVGLFVASDFPKDAATSHTTTQQSDAAGPRVELESAPGPAPTAGTKGSRDKAGSAHQSEVHSGAAPDESSREIPATGTPQPRLHFEKRNPYMHAAESFLFPTPGEDARRRQKVLAFMTWTAAKDCRIRTPKGLRTALLSNGAWAKDLAIDAELGFGGSRVALDFERSLTQPQAACLSAARTKIFGTEKAARAYSQLLTVQLGDSSAIKDKQQSAMSCLAKRTNLPLRQSSPSFDGQVKDLFAQFAPMNSDDPKYTTQRVVFGRFYAECAGEYFQEIQNRSSDSVEGLKDQHFSQINDLAKALQSKNYQP